MRLPKWLLLQMLQTRITCSKKKVKTFFFYYNTTLKWSQKCQNVAQMLPKSWSIEKEKSPKLLSDSDLGDFFSGATGIRTRDTRIFSPLLYQLSYGTIDNTSRDCECKGRQKFLICKFFPRFFIKFYYLCLCNQEIPIFNKIFICF